MASFNLLFDVKLFAAVRVNLEAESEHEAVERARAALEKQLDCINLGIVAEHEGVEIAIREASPDGEHDLVEVNGEEPADEY